jgi:HEAT repeat protein
MKSTLLSFFILFLVSGCNEKSPKSLNKFTDPILVGIYNYQDQRLTDSLYQFLTHSNPTYRLNAVTAFASIQDSLAIPTLGKILLNDPEENIRASAALAIGQTGVKEAFQILLTGMEKETSPIVRKEINESMGKAGGAESLEYVKTNCLENIVNNPGVSWMLYRYGLRGVVDSSTVNCAISRLIENDENERLGAAHFFARGKFPNPPTQENVIMATSLNDSSVNVRMAATSGLRFYNSELAFNTLVKIATADSNALVRISAIRSLSNFPALKCNPVLISLLENSSVNVSIAASEVLANKSTMGFEKEILIVTRKSTINWRVKANLYKSILAALPDNKELIEEIGRLYKSTTHNY